MLFNSQTFVIFFALVYGAYWLAQGRLKAQNRLLLAASLVFYGWWDWRFLGLLLFSITLDWYVGGRLSRSAERHRKKWLLTSLMANLSILGFFKYFGFFVDSFDALARSLGYTPSEIDLRIILPMGISFYTFQSLSYTVDVYRRQMEPCKSWVEYALYVSFFPQLVAGPIERASTLLPQVQQPRTMTATGIHAAIWLIAWGYFKKTVVADNLSPIADAAFDPASTVAGPAMWLGILAFAFQIYADFSGYSDIARGLSSLMGFKLMVNFRCPFFASNPSDFWRRWHISLSTWLRDYLYIPLGGNRLGAVRTYANLMITMGLGGLWHGARWNFVVWGIYHGALLAIHRYLSGRWPVVVPMLPPRVRIALTVSGMFVLTLLGWVFFRCQDGGHIVDVLARCWSLGDATAWATLPTVGLCLLIMVAADGLHQWTGDLLAPMHWSLGRQTVVLFLLVVAIGLFGVRDVREFIYFQF